MQIAPEEITFSAIRSRGNGGQNVNKVSTAMHLRFDIHASSLPLFVKEKLCTISDSRITAEGMIIIKADSFRTQEQNREDAIRRLQELVDGAAVVPKKRKKTKATKGSQERRLAGKSRRGEIKENRRKID